MPPSYRVLQKQGAGRKVIFMRITDFDMGDILCPHCEGDIELPDDEFGEFSCPLCEEDFIWEDESGPGDVSFIESEGIELSHKLAAIAAVIIVIFLIVMVIGSAISPIEETDTSSWPVEQVEIVEITNEGWRDTFGNAPYYRVEIRFMYENDERAWTLECDGERDAEVYVEDNPVGTTIDIRVNPVKGEFPFFDIKGGCPSVEETWSYYFTGVVCFGFIIATIGFEKIRDLIRSKRQG